MPRIAGNNRMLGEAHSLGPSRVHGFAKTVSGTSSFQNYEGVNAVFYLKISSEVLILLQLPSQQDRFRKLNFLFLSFSSFFPYSSAFQSYFCIFRMKNKEIVLVFPYIYEQEIDLEADQCSLIISEEGIYTVQVYL